MKTKFLLWSVCLAVAASATAQLLLPEKKGLPRKPTQIDSDRAEFDLTTRRAIYFGRVRVDDPELKLQCEQLTVDLPASGGQPTNIVAEVNVVIDFADSQGQTTRATGDRAVYHYAIVGAVTNATVTLTGGPPKVEGAQGTLTGKEIAIDIATRKVSATGQTMIFKQNLGGTMGTNAPGVKLF
jgi:lipopolysaccharide transport protein LptA